MKHIYLVTIVFVFISSNLFCQRQSNDYLTIVLDQPYEKLIRIDNHIFYELDKKKKKLYLDGKAIDSTGVKPYHMYLYKGDLLGYLSDLKNYYSIKIDLINKNIIVKSFPLRDSIIIHENLYATKEKIHDSKIEKKEEYTDNIYEKKIYEINPYTFSLEKLLCDLDNEFGKKDPEFKYHEIYQIINLRKTNKLLISTAYSLGGYGDFNYFIYDKKTGILKHDNKLIQNEPNIELYHVDFELTDISEDYFIGEYYDHFVKNEDHKGWFIFDSNLDIVTRILPHDYWNIGYNFNKGKVVSCNIKSRLDDNKQVIIIYKFSLPLERSLYRIYANQELIKEDINQCGQYELSLLKNMIYAKHNYKFNDLFYQAYFNMFNFYNTEENKSNRLTKVDPLFTESDEKNLKLILTKIK